MRFLRHIKRRLFRNGSLHNCPLDFFSWHSYAGLKENIVYADYASKKLAEYGYGSAEVIFNEWNPGIANRGKPCDASNIAAMMCAMQRTQTDMCMYYDGQISSSYCGLFDPVSGGVFKAYYAFRAFGELYAAENEAMSECNADDIYVCAAVNAEHKLALLVNTADNAAEIKLSPCGSRSCRATDDIHTWDETELNGDTVTLPAHAVWLVEYKN